MTPVFSGRTVFWLCLLVFLIPNQTCTFRYNLKNQPFRRYEQIIENVTLFNYWEKFTELNLQNVPELEFRNSRIRFFGEEINRALNYSTKSITFRQGLVSEILISSPALEFLKVINTNLSTLMAISSLNYSLRELTIHSKRFQEWSPSLKVLQALENIDISYCNFSHLNMEWFEPFPKLWILDVSNNRLTELDIGPEVSMGALQWLNLSRNRLERIPRFLDAFPKLGGASLSQNRWHCDWMVKLRDVVLSRDLLLVDMEYGVCQRGYVFNGGDLGLCCRPDDFSGDEGSEAEVDSEGY